MRRWRVLIGAVVSLGLVSLAIVMAAARFAAAQTQPTTAPVSSRWPMPIPTPDGQILVFQPQLEDFQGNTLTAHAAVEITTKDQPQPTYGAIWLKSRVATDRVARTVQILDVNITQTRFPNADAATTQNLTVAIHSALAANPPILSLDQLLTMLETVQKQQTAAANLQSTPPKIIFRDHPAVKVQYDGQPKLVTVDNSKLMRVVNTPFFVVLDPDSKTYYLKGAGRWFAAPDPMGPFQDANKSVPQPVTELADSSDYTDPQHALTDIQAERVEIITATEPTELIWTDGQPQMATISGTDLLYVSNTDADWFVEIDNQQNFLLLSGRWYSAPNQNGPWTFVPPDKLPADFAKIPPNSEKGDVLAHVSGTQAAQDAVADSAIPQTAAVDRSQFDQPNVQYDGPPQFQATDGGGCQYAINTSSAVIQCNGQYYCCDNGVWYQSPSPTGPWALCTFVPPDIYQIPPSCPVYPVTYCYVYGFTPQYVYCGYCPGYVGSFCCNGVIWFGTGYYYHPWWGRRYFPRPCTFGFAAHYNSYIGHWGFNFGLATGGGGNWIGVGAHAWGRENPWFGFGGYRPVVVHKDVHPDMFRAAYLERIHPGAVSRVAASDSYQRNLYDNRHDVHRELRPVQVDEHAEHPAEPPHEGDDVFTDRQGNVYRRNAQGGWEVHEKDQWRPGPTVVEPHPAEPQHDENQHVQVVRPQPQEPARPQPDHNFQEVNRDYNARVEAQQRLPNYERPAEQPHAEPVHSEPAHSEPAHVEPEPSAPPPPPQQQGNPRR